MDCKTLLWWESLWIFQLFLDRFSGANLIWAHCVHSGTKWDNLALLFVLNSHQSHFSGSDLAHKSALSISTSTTKEEIRSVHLFLDEGVEHIEKGWRKGGHHLFSQVSSDRMRGKDREVLLCPTDTSGVGKGAAVFSWLTFFFH